MKNKQVEQIKLKVLELSDSNDIYMTLSLLLVTSNPNLNKCIFTPDFIHEIVENKDFYIGGVSLVAERNKLEAGKKNLGHGLNKNGELISDVIGSFSDFSENQAEDNSWELLGTAKVFKRYPKVCESLVNLYNSGELSFSCEVLVSEYSKDDNGNKIVDKGNGQFIGQCVVGNPAEVKSKAFMMVSEALNIDLGSDNLNKNKTFEEMFQNTKIVIETSELDLTQIQRKVYSQFTELDDWYKYDIIEFSTNYIILLDYEGDLYRIDYSISGDNLTLGEMYNVSKTYTRIDNIIVNEEEKVKMDELQKELEQTQSLVESLKAEIASKDATIAEKENLIVERDTMIATKETEIAEKSTQLETLSASVIEKTNLLAELEPIKVEHETMLAQKAEEKLVSDRNALKDKYSKLLSAEVLTKVEIAEAIEKLDESVLKDAVIEVALASAKPTETKEVETATRITDEVKMGGDLVSKYITVSNS